MACPGHCDATYPFGKKDNKEQRTLNFNSTDEMTAFRLHQSGVQNIRGHEIIQGIWDYESRMMEFFEITHLLQSPVSSLHYSSQDRYCAVCMYVRMYLCVLVCLDGLDTRCGSPGLVRSDVCCSLVESGQIWRRNSISAFQGQETY